MISCDRVAEEQKAACVLDGSHGGWSLAGHSLEEGRMVDVCRILCPGEKLALRCLQVVPTLVSGECVRVELLEEGRSDDLTDECGNLFPGWPDIAEHHWVTRLISANGLRVKVDIHSASKCVGNDKRR